MKDAISRFLGQKSLSKNSGLSYSYDLHQFLEVCKHQVSPTSLALYQTFLQGLKPSAQRRKLSAVNQFLYFLYQEGSLERFYKLTTEVPSQRSAPSPVEEMAILLEPSDYPIGQVIALLVAHLGLLPIELAQLTWDNLDKEFRVLTVERDGHKRVLTIPAQLLPFLEQAEGAVYLFDRKGKPYSRQWFFNQLSAYTKSIGKPQWTAQTLREQYILHQLQSGLSDLELARQLGLKSTLSLEKYKTWI